MCIYSFIIFIFIDSYNSVKDSLWNAFEWYQRAGGLLAAQEAEALRAAQLSFFESSVAALRSVPSYGPAELTSDLNACSSETSINNVNTFESVPYQDNAEEDQIFSSPPVSNQDSENDLFETQNQVHVEYQEPEETVETNEHQAEYQADPPPPPTPQWAETSETEVDEAPPPPPPPPVYEE